MKGHDEIIALLNEALVDELSVINQYFLHAKMCQNWGYPGLYLHRRGQAMDEMHHAEWLMERILFLDGIPKVSKLGAVRVGTTVPDQFANDLKGEKEAVELYNKGIRLCGELGDAGTKVLLERILKEEEGHLDYHETQMGIIADITLPNYLERQIGTEGK